MLGRRQVKDRDKAEIMARLRRLLDERAEIRFACLHGSFLEPYGFRDVDVAVWVEPVAVPAPTTLDYEFRLAAWLEREVCYAVDVKVLNYAPLGFRYAATRGVPLLIRDEEEWHAFRERTWRAYFDFAPHVREGLLDLLETERPTGAGRPPAGSPP